MALLKIDKEAMKTAKRGYDDCVQRMTELQNTLKTAVDEIRSGWKSDGGKAFFEKFDDQWYKNFSDYIAVIGHMSDNMDIANQKYQEIFDEADKISLK